MNPPIDFGFWVTPSGQRHLLTWNPNGVLTLGASAVAHISDELDVRTRLAGWPDHCETRDGLGWLAQRLEGCR